MMSTVDDSQPEIYLNFYNGITQPKMVYIANSISPSPSAQSENSVECSVGKDTQNHHHDHDQDSSIGTCGEDDDPYDTVDVLDDSTQELTNLTWLTQLKSLVEWPNSVNPAMLDDDCGGVNGAADGGCGGGGGVKLNGRAAGAKNAAGAVSSLSKKDMLNDRFQRFLGQARLNRESYNKSAELYQMDTNEKPPFNYAQMIAMAMLENGRMTLQHIYSWIQNKFGYYRVRNNWNNSIRHNLSLQFCFRKIERNVYNKGDGKGGYWELGIDVNKSERKRIRNRSGAAQKSKTLVSPEVMPVARTQDDNAKRRRRQCDNDAILSRNDADDANVDDPDDEISSHRNYTNQQDIDLIVDDLADSNEDNNYLFNRTLNSINATMGMDQILSADDLGIGSIIEVDQQIAQVVTCAATGTTQHIQDTIGQSTNEYHVLGDITHGDYLNISTLDLMSSAADMFDDDGNDFSTADSGSGGRIVVTGPIDSNQTITGDTSQLSLPTLIATMVNSECVTDATTGSIGSEIFLASEVPQPSENVVIPALHPFDDADVCAASTVVTAAGALQSNHITTANVIIESDTIVNSLDSHFASKMATQTDADILMKAFSLDGIGHEFHLLTNCGTIHEVVAANRDDLIEVLYDIQTTTTHSQREF